MKFEIETPEECSECVFCSELCFCLLMYGEPLGFIMEGERAQFCPFDNEKSRQKMDQSVKIIEE